MRILIIDDDEDLRALLAHYLRDEWPEAEVEPYDPVERGAPDETFPLADYDAVILDYMLGRGNGLDWLQRLKQRSDCPPVLFLTGAGNEIIAVRAMKAGAESAARGASYTAGASGRIWGSPAFKSNRIAPQTIGTIAFPTR